MLSDEARNKLRREKLGELLAEIYWKDKPPYSELAVRAAALMFEKSPEEARKYLEDGGA